MLFLLVGAREPAGWTITLIIGATARLAHTYGMLSATSLAAESKIRLGGALGTYLFGTALAVTAAVSVL